MEFISSLRRRDPNITKTITRREKLFNGQRGFEQLELRNMLSITLSSINNVQEPGGKSVVVPLTGVDSTSGQAINYSFQSSNPNVSLSLVSPGTPSLELNVTGTDKSGTAFSGTLILKLFTTLTPATTAQIESLVGSNFYNGTTFARVLDGFVAQAGFTASGGTTSSQKFNDEFTSKLTFTSPGLLAMANAGADTNTNQFFITAIDSTGSTTPIPLSSDPQFLDFRYTIFGQLVSGFDTFEKIMSTNVKASTIISGETSQPTQPITITSASIINDNQNAVLMISAPASEVGNTATITVTATDGLGSTAIQTFTDSIVANTQIDPPFLGTASAAGVADETQGVTNQTTPENTPVTFTLTSTDLQAKGVTYSVVDAATGTAPTNATVSIINQATGAVTLTPSTGFTGSEKLLARVTAASGGDTNAAADSQAFTLTVTPSTPAAPTGLTASAIATNQVNLAFTAPSGPVTGYNVFRGTTAGGESTTPLNSTPLAAGATTYADTSAVASTTYFYTVQALNSTASSPMSNEASATTPAAGLTAPAAPTNLTATAKGADEIDLSFTGSTGTVTGYNVFRGTTAGGESLTPLNSTPLSSTATSYQDTTVTANTTFFYVVTALNSTATSPNSNEATATTLSAPAAPTALTATAPLPTQVNLSFTAPSGTITGFNVFRGTAAGGESTTPLNSTPLAASATTYQDTTAVANTTYFYRVTALNSTAVSPVSTEATVTTPSATVAPPTSLTLDSSSETGHFTNDNYTSSSTPKLNATAPTGDTVKFLLNGAVIATASETTAGSGQFSATLPAGTLAVGANSLTATTTDSTGTSVASSPLAVTYAPSFAQVYTVPGTPGSAQQLTFTWTSRKANYNNEIGVYTVSDLSGTVAGTAPTASGYAQAAVGSSTAQTVFTSGQGAGATQTISVTGGQLLGFYLIQNNTTANFVAQNPSNTKPTQANGNINGITGQPLAFFSTTAANPDQKQHVQAIADPTTGNVEYNWEDLYSLGDSDFNDVVMTVGLAAGQTAEPSTLHVPDATAIGTSATANTLTLSATLASGTKATTAPGDVGVYFVDNPAGAIGSLTPSSSGYLAAALASANSQVLIPSGTAAAASHSISVPAGKYIAFYAISSGTTATFLTANPSNSTSTSGLPVAFLSFSSANPSQIDHFRFLSPEGVSTAPAQIQLHIMDQVFGSDANFDDLDVTLSFTGPSSSSG